MIRVYEKREASKWCPRCEDWVDKSRFHRNSSKLDGLESHCSSCSSDAQLLKRFGITRAQWMRMLADQGGQCAMCETSDPGGSGTWHTDHDHSCCSGRTSCGNCVRGLLCVACNKYLGLYEDDMKRRQAEAYLKACSSKVDNNRR